MSSSSEEISSKDKLDKNKSLLYHVNKYLSKSFLKLPRIRNQQSTVQKDDTSNDFLAYFTSFVMIPTKVYYSEKSDVLMNLGNIWLNQYLQKLIMKHQKSVVFNELDLQMIGNMKLKLTKQWSEQIQFIENFYDNFQLICPICVQNIPNFNSDSNIISLLMSHQCTINTELQHLHYCPCGKLFLSHKSFLKHILPVSIKQFTGLALSICPISTFYWLITAVSSVDLSNDYLSPFNCLMCSKNSDVKKNNFQYAELPIQLDFYSWMYHIIADCPSFINHRLLETDNNACFFCISYSSIPRKTMNNFPPMKFSILNSLNTDFNLNLFKLEDFFDFSLDFNLSQKLRPSDFLTEFQNIENFVFNKEDIIKIDFLFLNLPYSCSKCLIRFKDISLKYNHNCYTRKGDDSSNSTHICRCGNLTDNHLSFWNHIFDNCIVLTYIYLIMFSILKKINILKCFCEKFCTTSKSISQLISHWKKCQFAYHIFAKHCRYCYSKKNLLTSYSKNSWKIETIDENIKSFIPFENTKLIIQTHNQSPCHSSMSLVANRCQIFSSYNCIESKSIDCGNNFKFGIMETIQLQEQAALIQPTFHLLENISVKIHENFYKNVIKYFSQEILSDTIQIKNKNLLYYEKIEHQTDVSVNSIDNLSNCIFSNFNYIDYSSDSIDIDIKFKKSVFNRIDWFGKFHSSIHTFLSKLKLIHQSSKPNFMNYLEEFPEKYPKRNTIMYYYKKLMNMRKEKKRFKRQFRVSMLPLFRKLASPHYNNESETFSPKNFQVQYLQPYIYPLANSRNSMSEFDGKEYSQETKLFFNDHSHENTSKFIEYFNNFDDHLNSFASV